MPPPAIFTLHRSELRRSNFGGGRMLAVRSSSMLPFMRMTLDVATCMYCTGIDPMTKKPVQVANKLHDRKMQRALMQFFKPENYFLVREALIKAGRQDLIGNGCDALIPATPPKVAIDARRRRANDPDHYHTVANPAKGEGPGKGPSRPTGYRPGRSSLQWQHGKRPKKSSR